MNNTWLEAAYYQAERSQGLTGKNPAVGCVIVNEGNIVGVGSTSSKGRPHAEENALAMAGNKSKGSTLYVTLEPCDIEGNENSCTNQIIRAGVKKVVIGMLDPNKKTFTRSLKKFRKEGIAADVKELTLKNFLFNFSHYCYHNKKRPKIALKLATSADSKITYDDGSSKWITSLLARKHVHQIRSFYNGVLVGANTFRKDNPILNARIQGFKSDTTRIILDSNLSIDKNSKLIESSNKFPLIIFTKKNKTIIKNLSQKKGIAIYPVREQKKGKLNLHEIIDKFNYLNLHKILVEGGSKVAASFLNLNLIDKIYIYKSSNFIGSKGLDAINELKLNSNFFIYDQINLEDNRIEVWLNKNIIQMYRKQKCLQESQQI